MKIYQFYKISLFTLCLICAYTHLFAQPFVDVVSLQYQSFATAQAKDSSNDQLSTGQLIGNIFLPIELKKDNVLLLGAVFDNYAFTLEADSPRVGNLISSALFLGGIKQWNEKWSMMFLGIPRLSSDLGRINVKHFQMGGVVIMTVKKSDDLKFKFGLFYNRDFFGNFWMPLAGIDWNVSEHLNIFGILPGSMNVEYKLSDKFYTGVSYKSITASFRLSDQDERYYVREGHRFWGHNQLRAYVNYYPVKSLVIFAEVGHTAWRRYELYENGKSNTTDPLLEKPVYRQFENGLFLSVGIAFRVRLDQVKEPKL